MTSTTSATGARPAFDTAPAEVRYRAEALSDLRIRQEQEILRYGHSLGGEYRAPRRGRQRLVYAR